MLCRNFQFVNAGLRGHQFVKEGAEEVLELGGLCRVRPNFVSSVPSAVANFDLLLKRRYCERDVPEVGLVEDAASLIIVLLQQADDRSSQMVK